MSEWVSQSVMNVSLCLFSQGTKECARWHLVRNYLGCTSPGPGLPRWPLVGKELACQCRRHKRRRFNPWIGKIPWRRKWQPTPVFLPGESHGQRNLAVYSPWGHKALDTTEVAEHMSMSLGPRDATWFSHTCQKAQPWHLTRRFAFPCCCSLYIFLWMWGPEVWSNTQAFLESWHNLKWITSITTPSFFFFFFCHLM